VRQRLLRGYAEMVPILWGEELDGAGVGITTTG